MRGRTWVAVSGLVLAASALVGSPAHASTDDCVAEKVDDGMERAAALEECLDEARRQNTSNAADDEEGGTSIALVLGAGLVGLLVGAGAALAWSRTRRDRAPGTPPAVLVAAPPMTLPTPVAVDRAGPLIGGLVDLSDRVPSQALRAEILAALERAGVRTIEVATGHPFDAASMRGVGSAPAPDATWAGRVASTERPGFRDGDRVIRPPDVIVYTPGG